MTTTPSHQLKPMSAEHVRWAVRDACRGMKGRDVQAEGPAGPFSTDEAFGMLSRLGARDGMREFLSRVLVGGDDDAEHVSAFVGRFPREMRKDAAKALFRLIAMNVEEDKTGLDIEDAFAKCVRTAEWLMGKGCGVSLGFLNACSSSKFGAAALSKNAEIAEDTDLAETASEMAEVPEPGAVVEFYGAVFSIAERIPKEHRDGLTMEFNGICAALLKICPEAAYYMCEKACYPGWKDEGELAMLLAVFSIANAPISGAPALFTDANRETKKTLANECEKLAASFSKAIRRHCTEGLGGLVVPYLKAYLHLSAESPRAAVRFSSAFNSMVSGGAEPEKLLTSLDFASSPRTMEIMRQLEGAPQALGKYIGFLLNSDGVRN